MSNNPALDVFAVYENGKHRRYSLLFSVNGGAFAIAQLLAKSSPVGTWTVGHLSFRLLSLGMFVFTILMTIDIYTFADKMREIQKDARPEIFAEIGKVVLFSIGAMICAGWILAGIW